MKGKTPFNPINLEWRAAMAGIAVGVVAAFGMAKVLATSPSVAGSSVSPELFKEEGDSDDAPSINRALVTGKTVRLSNNKTYEICSPLIVHSHQELAGGNGTWIMACGKWNEINGRGEREAALIRNDHWAASEIVDAGITIHGLGIDGVNLQTPSNGHFHAIAIRMARDVRVYDLNCKNIGDCTAFQADDNYEIHDSVATGISNAGFDNWEGPRNGTVRHTSTVCVGGKNGGRGRGVMFTGASTDYRATVGFNLTSESNEVAGPCISGIEFNNLALGSSLTNIRSLNDHVDAKASESFGIIISGDVNGGRIVNLVVANTTTGQAIALRPERYSGHIAMPSRIEIASPVLTNVSTSAANVAPISIFGKDNRVSNVHLRGGHYTYAVRTTDPNLTVTGEIDAGLRGMVVVERPPK